MKSKLTYRFKSIIESICANLENSILSDKSLKYKVVYGLSQSRRLGSVLGINNVNPGVCSYNCIYCPSGKTSCCSVCTQSCLSPYKLYVSIKNKLGELKNYNKKIEFILFAGSGEPTLDSHLSKEILILREFGYKIAVFTNSSLLWNYNIQENLMFADYVSLKIDTLNEDTWLKINRPHRRLKYDLIIQGIKQFSRIFKGTLTTGTTLIKNINDNEEEIKKLGDYFRLLKPKISYFIKSIYPPANNNAITLDAETLSNISRIITDNVSNSVLLNGVNNGELFVTDDFEDELLGLLAIHPIKEDAINNFVKSNHNVEKLNELLLNKVIKQIEFNGGKYFSLN